MQRAVIALFWCSIKFIVLYSDCLRSTLCVFVSGIEGSVFCHGNVTVLSDIRLYLLFVRCNDAGCRCIRFKDENIYYLSLAVRRCVILAVMTMTNHGLGIRCHGTVQGFNDHRVTLADYRYTLLPASSAVICTPTRYTAVDVNVAVATDSGLVTPIVFGADTKVSFLWTSV